LRRKAQAQTINALKKKERRGNDLINFIFRGNKKKVKRDNWKKKRSKAQKDLICARMDQEGRVVSEGRGGGVGQGSYHRRDDESFA